MNATEMLAKAEAELKAIQGYRYNPAVLEEVIVRGTIEEGAIVASTASGVQLVYFADRIATLKDGEEVQTTPMSEKAFEAALVMYAKREAKRRVVN